MMKRIVLTVMLMAFAIQADAAKRVLNGRIAFLTERDGNTEVYSMNQNGTGQTRLTDNPAADSLPAWSPDGSRIAFVSDRDGNQEIYVMNENGSEQIRLTFNAGKDSFPAWSPDGRRIAFVSERDGNREIYVMNANGANPVRLTVNAAFDSSPEWSPDGQRIAFESDRETDESQIFIMDADGNNPTRLTSRSDGAHHPSFSPDGSKIVFSGFNDPLGIFGFGRFDIFVMSVDGTNQVGYSAGPGAFDITPTFSPDGSKITFAHSGTDGAGIGVMNADGTDFELITADNEAQPSWQRVAPINTVGVYRPSTGQWILRNSHRFVALIPDITLTFGGEPGDLPVAGDWNGDGRTDIGIFRNGTFLLALLKTVWTCAVCGPSTEVDPIPSVEFGRSGDLPVAGDWNGDAKDDLGVFRPGDGNVNASFHLRVPEIRFVRPCPTCPFALVTTFDTVSRDFGSAADLPVAGDWDGDGKETIGVLQPATTGTFILTDDFAKPFSFAFGTTGDRPLAGDWQGRFADRVGVFRPSTREMRLATKLFSDPDLIFRFGSPSDIPVAGHWLPTP